MLSWWNVNVNKIQVDKLANSWNLKFHVKTNLWYDKIDTMSIWQNVNLTKCQFDKMSIWQNVNLTKCQFDKMSIWQKSGWKMSKWQNV